MLPVVILAALLLAACSSGSNDETTEPPATTDAPTSSTPAVTTAPAGVPAWATALGAPATVKRADAGGVEVWVDESNRTIYVRSCDAAQSLTAEGQPYGPSARDADGNYREGFAYICPS